MKKVFIVGLIAVTLGSCANKAMISECQEIAEKEMDGFTLRNTSVDPVEGLKLVIPDEFVSAAFVASIGYESEDNDYKSCTCYFDQSNKLLGFDAK